MDRTIASSATPTTTPLDGADVPTVVVVGAGFAGTLTAAGLLRAASSPLRVLLVERSGQFGPGVAYSTEDRCHLLNVVAERMSAFPDEPCHFVDWARDTLGDVDPGSYLPRALFGEYVRSILDDAERSAPARCSLERVRGEVVDVAPGATVRLSDGRAIAADQVVLALGPLDGAPPVALPDDPRVISNPWEPGALRGGDPDGTTLLIGSGLTAVDVALSVCGEGSRGRVVAISRGGCLPFEQLPGLRQPVPAPRLPSEPATVDQLERWFRLHVGRARRAGHDWRDVIDGVRPHVTRLWQTLPLDQRRRYVRERSRAWELRRHRMAPEIAERMRALLTEGRLLVRAGRIVAVRALPRTVEVLVGDTSRAGAERDGTRPEDLRTLRMDRVVLCAGPGGDVERSEAPLVRSLLDRGLATPDELGMGLQATPAGELLAADGDPQSWLHVLGPLRRGELWETTAVGEIRAQAQTVARAVAARCRV